MFPRKRDFTAALVKRFPDIKSVTFSVNRSPDFMTLGEHDEVLYGSGYIVDEICGKKFRISPHILYAYSGMGTIGIIASNHVNINSVQGVEYTASAVRDAVQNCRLNGITRRASFKRGDAGEYLMERARPGTSFNTVFMDTARAGADRRFLRAVGVRTEADRVYLLQSRIAGTGSEAARRGVGGYGYSAV